MFVKHGSYHIQNICSGNLTDILHLQLITCIMYISKFKNKRAYLGAVNVDCHFEDYYILILEYLV